MKFENETDIHFQDLYLRIVFTPLFGILIPYLSGILKQSLFPKHQYLPAYIYFTLVAFLIWEGNLRVLRYNLKQSTNSLPNYLTRLTRYVVFSILLSLPLLYAWFLLPSAGLVNHLGVLLCTVMIVIAIMIISSFYESVILIFRNKQSQLQNEKLASAKLHAELESLKNSIDPHFIFNSLNTLSYLIETDPDKATEFCNGLSEVYRYVLRNKNTSYVFLDDELHFLRKYESLLRIRFGDSVQLKIDTGTHNKQQLLVAPVTLQILVENALKHNGFDEENPLIVSIYIEADKLVVSNVKRPTSNLSESHGMGLKILNERLQLLMNEALTIENDKTAFTVRIPLPKLLL